MVWICDSCGNPIEQAQDGWIEWIIVYDSDKRRVAAARDLRLVHHSRECRFDWMVERRRDNGIVHDDGLESFLGTDGLVRLLRMMARPNGLDPSDIAVLVSRLHVPGYEQARTHIRTASSEGLFSLDDDTGLLRLDQIEVLLNEYGLEKDHRTEEDEQ